MAIFNNFVQLNEVSELKYRVYVNLFEFIKTLSWTGRKITFLSAKYLKINFVEWYNIYNKLKIFAIFAEFYL